MRQQTMAGVTNEPIQKDMLTARFGKYLAILLLMSVVGELHAATYFFASSPSLRDVVTADAYLGNSDDVIIDGANPQGAASQTFFTSIGTSAFFVGQMTTQGLTPFGPTPAHIFGANEHTSVNIFGPGISASLNTDTPSIITTDRDQSYTASFVLNDTRSAGGRVGLSGIGYYLKRSQIASELYSGDLLTHFETVIPLLHRSWQGVGHQIESWEILDGPRVGATGMNTVTFFTFDGVPPRAAGILASAMGDDGFCRANCNRLRCVNSGRGYTIWRRYR